MAALFTPAERQFLTATADLAYTNPFLPERYEREKQALGPDYKADDIVWSSSVSDPDARPHNIIALERRLTETLRDKPDRLRQLRTRPSDEDLRIYEDSVRLLIYQHCHDEFVQTRGPRMPYYRRYLGEIGRYFAIEGFGFETLAQPEHVFACFHQIHRAFHAIFDRIIGSSMPAAKLRASVWQSVFTHDMRLWSRTLYRRMGDFPTLITGPSGTGKEIVARAIAESRYVPFNPTRQEFTGLDEPTFFPVNLAALSPTLIESELFGHRRGAFTGAVTDRKGYLEACPPTGSVFLDEIGELDAAVQVKLLRVIETRRFSPVGDTGLHEFGGKLVAATNRDLTAEIAQMRFREDLYYRLCADLIRTPSLKEQLDDSPAILRDLVLYMLRRTVGADAEGCLPEVERWIATHLPRDYPWPGNYRELEQCVRNVIIRRSYEPLRPATAPADPELDAVWNGRWTADQVLTWYTERVYRSAGTYEEAARRLGLDRRTVKAKVDAVRSSRAAPDSTFGRAKRSAVPSTS